jgi:hypothetical protein
MRQLALNDADWTTKDDIYDAFFAPSAPEWHGSNLNAIADSISDGSINRVEVQYTLVIISYDKIGPVAKPMTVSFIKLIH